jgi:hypothetical protein
MIFDMNGFECVGYNEVFGITVEFLLGCGHGGVTG